MRSLDDWFGDWLDGHLIRHTREGLPAADSEDGAILYLAWKKLFRSRGVHDLEIAVEASERLLAEPPRYVKDHFAQLLRYALELYQVRGIAAGSGIDPHSREAAEGASRGCVHCDGGGLAVVRYHKPRIDPRVPLRTADGRAIPDVVAACCICALGRWIERDHRERSPDIRRRMPDLADALAGRSVWLADQPDAIPAARARGPGEPS